MAEKKYLDLTGLGQYDAKIKAKIAADDATTLESAKSYADGLASNYEAAGNVATGVAEAKAYTDTEVAKANAAAAAADTKAAQGVADAAKAQAAADKAQGEVDALEILVGTLPDTATAETIVAYVDEKTAGIATEGAMTELAGRVTTVEGKVSTIEGDYLKNADKEALQGEIAAAQEAAEEAAVDRVLGYLAEEEVNVDFDTLKEVAAWIESDTTRAAELTTRVSTAEGKITAAEGKITALEGEMDTAQADIAALQAAIGDEGSVDSMIDAAVAAEAKLREEADAALDTKISANAAAAKAADDKAVAAQGEVDALELVVAEKAAQADLDAAVGRIGTAEGKITALEGASHTHDNKTVLDGVTADKVAGWDDAAAKAHEHSNKDVLDGISATLVSNWNAAETNAKAYVDEQVGQFSTITTAEVDALFA